MVVTDDLSMYALKSCIGQLSKGILRLQWSFQAATATFNIQHCHFQWGLVFLWKPFMKAVTVWGKPAHSCIHVLKGQIHSKVSKVFFPGRITLNSLQHVGSAFGIIVFFLQGDNIIPLSE